MTPAERTRQLRRLEGLASFLPVFEAPGFGFVSWKDSRDKVTGMASAPFCDLSPATMTFIEPAYELD